MHEISLIDETFDLSFSSEYHLSIQLGLDGFSFCVLDKIQRKYVVLQHFPLIEGKAQFLAKKIEHIFEQEEKLNATYKSVLVSYSTNKVTLLPQAFGNTKYNRKILGLGHQTDRTEEIESNLIGGLEQQLIFAYPKEVRDFLNSKFSSFRFMHKSIPLLGTAVSQGETDKNAVIINFEKKYVRIIVLKGKEIALYNSFYFKNEVDFLYYTLNVCDTLQVDPEQDNFLLGGYVADDSNYVRQLKKYVSNIRFLKPDPDFYYSYTFDKIPKHFFVSLLNSYSCEL